MAEIIDFLGKDAQKQIVDYISNLKKIAVEYKSIATAANDLQKAEQAQIKTESDLLKKQQEAEKLSQQRIKTSEADRKAKAAINKELEKEAKNTEKSKSAYEQLNAKYRESAKVAKDLAVQYGVNSKEARKAAKEAKNYGDQLKKVDAAAAGQNFRKVGSYFTEGFKSILAAGGVMFGITAVFNGIKSMITSMVGFEKALSSLSAITGASGKDLDFFKKAAIDTSKKTTQSATDIVKAYEKVGSASPELLKNKEALAAVTEQAIILSEATGGELGLDGAISAVTASMNQFGLGGKDAVKIVNTLAAGSLEGSAGVASISEAMKNVGTVAKTSNMTLEETVASLEVLGEKQLFGAEAGTKLRGVLLRLKDAGLGYASGTFKLSDAIDEANSKLEKMGSQTDKDAYSAKLFGAENITAGNIILQNKQKYIDLTKAVTDTTTALDQQQIQNDNVAGAFSQMSNKWDSFILSLTTGGGVLSNFFKRSLQLAGVWIEALDSLTKSKDQEREEADAERAAEFKRRMGDEMDFLEIRYKKNKEILSKELTDEKIWAKSVSQLREDLVANQLTALNNLKDKEKGTQKQRELWAKTQLSYAAKIQALDEYAASRKEEINKKVNLEIGDLSKKLTDEQIAAAKKLADEQNKLGEDYLKGIMEQMAFDKKAKEDGLKAADDYAKKKKAQEEASLEATRLINEQEYLDEKAKYDKIDQAALDHFDNLESTMEFYATHRKVNFFDTYFGMTGEQQEAVKTQSIEFVNTLFSLQQSRLDREMAAVDAYYEARINAASANGEDTEKLEQEYAQKRWEIELKQAESEKKQALFNVAIQTAQNIVAAKMNPYLIALAIAIGASQAAIIQNQPLPAAPAYAKGTDNSADTFLAGEKGKELIITKEGEAFVTPNKGTMYSGLAGSKVISNSETMRILNGNATYYGNGKIEKELKGIRKDLKENRPVVNIINRYSQRYENRYNKFKQ